MTWAHKAGERLRAMRSDEGTIDALIALLHWLRGDRVERPWRLTRRQRVEMEAAAAALRGRIRVTEDVDGWYSAETYDAARALEAYAADARDAGVPESVLRARVAIALRAALRADEDARCEEAQRDHDRRVARVSDAVWRTGADVASWAMVVRLREWPPLPWGRVPLALWEVVR